MTNTELKKMALEHLGKCFERMQRQQERELKNIKKMFK